MPETSPARAQPPAPPDFPRRLRFGWTQIIGVGLLSLLPIVALTGALGSIERETHARSGALVLNVRYPASMHYKAKQTVELHARNDGAQALRDVRVRFDDAYLSRFDELHFTPQVSLLDERHAEIALGELDAGATRRVLLHFEADRYGRARGSISVVAESAGEARVDVSTLVLP